jgi:hypothetical protein
MTKQEAYTAMVAADATYERALKAEYGRGAGNARYKTAHANPVVESARAAYRAAGIAWWEAGQQVETPAPGRQATAGLLGVLR